MHKTNVQWRKTLFWFLQWVRFGLTLKTDKTISTIIIYESHLWIQWCPWPTSKVFWMPTQFLSYYTAMMNGCRFTFIYTLRRVNLFIYQDGSLRQHLQRTQYIHGGADRSRRDHFPGNWTFIGYSWWAGTGDKHPWWDCHCLCHPGVLHQGCKLLIVNICEFRLQI